MNYSPFFWILVVIALLVSLCYLCRDEDSVHNKQSWLAELTTNFIRGLRVEGTCEGKMHENLIGGVKTVHFGFHVIVTKNDGNRC